MGCPMELGIITDIIARLKEFISPLLAGLDITNGFNPRLVGIMFFLITIGEANLHIPLLIESIWLIVGFQAGVTPNESSVLNLAALFVLAQLGRQIGMTAMYHIINAVNKPLSRLYMKPLQKNKYYKKYADNEYLYNLKFLSVFPATLGMMTPLNGPLKVMLIVKRKLRLLLIGTLLSGMTFDLVYIFTGTIFHTTTLNISYLPIFLLVGFLSFLILVFVRKRILHDIR